MVWLNLAHVGSLLLMLIHETIRLRGCPFLMRHSANGYVCTMMLWMCRVSLRIRVLENQPKQVWKRMKCLDVCFPKRNGGFGWCFIYHLSTLLLFRETFRIRKTMLSEFVVWMHVVYLVAHVKRFLFPRWVLLSNNSKHNLMFPTIAYSLFRFFRTAIIMLWQQNN